MTVVTGAGGLVSRMADTHEPYGVGALVRLGIAVEEVADCFFERTADAFCGVASSGKDAGGGLVLG